MYFGDHKAEAYRILEEIADTELHYDEDLEVMMTIYLEPARKQLFFDNTSLMLFHNLALDLIEGQKKFQTKLTTHTNRLYEQEHEISDVIFAVGDDFVTSSKHFSIYPKYVVATAHVQKALDGKEGKNCDKLAKFMADRLQVKNSDLEVPEARFLRKQKLACFQSLVIRPLQRMMMYSLLLERLEKQTDPGSTDKDKVEQALILTKKIGSEMNDAMTKNEGNSTEYTALLKQYGIHEYSK